MDLRVLQPLTDRTQTSEIANRCSERADRRSPAHLEWRRSGQQAFVAVVPHNVSRGQGEVVHVRWKKAAVRDRIEEDKVVCDSVTAADNGFALSWIPGET